MPTRSAAQNQPDLFATTAKSEEIKSRSVTQGENNPAFSSRYLLPQDLVGALKRLADAEIDSLLAAVTAEARRRNRLPSTEAKETALATQRRRGVAVDGTRSLSASKVNAVRAAFSAGVKPPTIARQFGISQSDVRRALAEEGRGGNKDVRHG
jgi:hypothetical protein